MRRVFYGWIVVAASATIVCVALGCLFALGVFLAPIERAMGWSRGAISTVALLNWIAMGLGSFFWGALSDRIGGRGVAVGGGFLLGLGLVLASQAQALWQFSLSFGFLVGFAAGAFYAPLTATTTRWFTARRGLAVALVSAGIGFGILLIAPLARALTSAWDWRVAMLVLGDLAWLVIVPVALLLRALGADLPHGHARHGPGRGRHGGGDGVRHLRPGLDRRPCRWRAARRPLRRQADADHRSGDTGRDDLRLSLRARPRRLRGPRAGLRRGVRRGHAPLRAGHARVLRRKGHGHRVRRGLPDLDARHGGWLVRWRRDLRSARRIHVAVPRLCRDRRDGRRARLHLPPPARRRPPTRVFFFISSP